MRERKVPTLYKTVFLQWFFSAAGVLAALCIFSALLMTALVRQNETLMKAHQTEKLRQALDRVEAEYQNADYAQLALLTNQRMQRIIYLYDSADWYKRYTMQTTLQEDLYRLTDAYRYVLGAYLYIPSLDKCISNQRVSQPVPAWLEPFLASAPPGICFVDDRLLNIRCRYGADNTTLEAVLVMQLNTEKMLEELTYAKSESNDGLKAYFMLSDSFVDLETKTVSVPLSSNDGTRRSIRMESGLLHFAVAYQINPAAQDKMQAHFYAMIAGFLLVMLLYEALTLTQWYKKIYRPLHVLLVEAFDKAEEGDLKHRITADAGSPFYPVYESYNHMMARMEAYVENNLKQQILVSKANLKQLQSQISPHFMYNSYYVLYRLIKKGDMESSVRLSEHLGQFYHYVTRNADDEKRLLEEVEHARTYAQIQQFRFRDMLAFHIPDPPAEIARSYIPRLVLQPILENAFKHAYENNDSAQPMRLEICYEVLSRYRFDIIVQNSGYVSDETLAEIRGKLDDTQDGETTALVNIHRRLKIYYGGHSCLMVERSPLGGLLVRMHISNERKEDEDDGF